MNMDVLEEILNRQQEELRTYFLMSMEQQSVPASEGDRSTRQVKSSSVRFPLTRKPGGTSMEQDRTPKDASLAIVTTEIIVDVDKEAEKVAQPAPTQLNPPESPANMSPIASSFGFSEQAHIHKARSKTSTSWKAREEVPEDLDDSYPWSPGSRNHQYFEGVIAFMIVLNAILVGAEVEYAATNFTVEVPPIFIGWQIVFCLVFIVELGLRLHGSGLQAYQQPGRGWLIFDTIIVLSAILELIFMAFSDSVPFLVVSRLARIVRTVRIIRLVPLLKDLQLMVTSVFMSLKTLAYAMLLMLFVLYTCSICLTRASVRLLVQEDFTSWSAPVGDTPERMKLWMLKRNFGTLPRSTFSLFKAVLGGVSWGELSDTLELLDWWYTLIFLAYITFTLLAFVNVITGFFCESALDLAAQDKDAVIREQLKHRQKYIDDFGEIYKDMDQDGSGDITLDELEAQLNSDRLRAYLAHLNLDCDSAWDIFRLLDTDSSGTITVEEFVDGCLRLRGPARKMDLADVGHEVKKIQSRLEKFMEYVAIALQELGATGPVERQVHHKVAKNHAASPRHQTESKSEDQLFEEAAAHI